MRSAMNLFESKKINSSMERGDLQYAVVVGCGRLGSLLAGRLSATGVGVVVIDRREESFGNLPPEFSGFKIAGDAVELAVLRAAKTAKADCFLATTEDDNINLMTAQVAKVEFNVPVVIARLFDPKREKIYKRLGIETISPTRLTAEAFMGALMRKESGNS